MSFTEGILSTPIYSILRRLDQANMVGSWYFIVPLNSLPFRLSLALSLHSETTVLLGQPSMLTEGGRNSDAAGSRLWQEIDTVMIRGAEPVRVHNN